MTLRVSLVVRPCVVLEKCCVMRRMTRLKGRSLAYLLLIMEVGLYMTFFFLIRVTTLVLIP